MSASRHPGDEPRPAPHEAGLKRAPAPTLRRALPLTVGAVLALLLIGEGAYWQSLDTLGRLQGIQQMDAQAERLDRSVNAAEDLAHRQRAAPSAEVAGAYADARAASLDALARLDPGPQVGVGSADALADMRAITLRRLQALDALIALRPPARPGTAGAGGVTAADAAAEKAAGAADLARLHSLVEHWQVALTVERDRTHRSLSDRLLLTRLGMVALGAGLLLALVLYLRKHDALDRTLSTQHQLMQAAHDRLEREAGVRTSELTQMTHHLLTAREDERHRLARNLHDDLGSLLTAAKLDAARVKSRLGADAGEARARLSELVAKLDGGIALGRHIIEDLRPSTLSHLGLAATLNILLSEFGARSGVQVHVDLQAAPLAPSAELVVFRVVQEAITNVSKYAGARQVWLTLGPASDRPGWVAVTVRDDGSGFDTQAATRSSYGLLGMRFRVEAEGGRLDLRSQPGEGTLIRAWLPGLAADARPAAGVPTPAPPDASH